MINGLLAFPGITWDECGSVRFFGFGLVLRNKDVQNSFNSGYYNKRKLHCSKRAYSVQE